MKSKIINKFFLVILLLILSAIYSFNVDADVGNYLFKWGSLGSGDGQFNKPRDVSIGVSGKVYTAERVNHRIQVFDLGGNFITKWGSLGSGNGQLDRPNGIAVDGTGNVYVAETYNHRIQAFEGFPPDDDGDGVLYLQEVDRIDNPVDTGDNTNNGLAFIDGRMFLGDHSTIYEVDPESSAVIKNFSPGVGFIVSLAGNNANGLLYLSDCCGNEIKIINPDTESIVGSLSVEPYAMLGLAIENGKLYATSNSQLPEAPHGDLYEIDLISGNTLRHRFIPSDLNVLSVEVFKDTIFVGVDESGTGLIKEYDLSDLAFLGIGFEGTSTSASAYDGQFLWRVDDQELVKYEVVLHQPPWIDIPPDYWAEEHIDKIHYWGITKGCSQDPLMFCPENTVYRDQMAVFLGRATHDSNFTPPAATGIFADVPVCYWAADWIEQFYADGLTKGCKIDPHSAAPVIYYCPKYPVTRTTMAIFLLRAKHGANYQPPPAKGIFGDVGVNYWAADWIEQLYKEGITKGCKQNPLMYCPANHVTRAQMAVFLTRMLGL